jgi:hypothetical protein
LRTLFYYDEYTIQAPTLRQLTSFILGCRETTRQRDNAQNSESGAETEQAGGTDEDTLQQLKSDNEDKMCSEALDDIADAKEKETSVGAEKNENNDK